MILGRRAAKEFDIFPEARGAVKQISFSGGSVLCFFDLL